MDAHARASIDLQGTQLRYAEIEHYGAGRYHLLRLGTCDFDFDVAQAILETGAPAHLRALTDALREVFAGSQASQLRVVLHPPYSHTFFSSTPSRWSVGERRQWFRQELAWLHDAEQDLHLTAEPLHTERPERVAEPVTWHHILAIPQATHDRVLALLRGFTQAQQHLSVSMQGVAATVRQLEAHAPTLEARAQAPYALALGWYPTHLEYTLCHGDRWVFSHHSAAGPPANSFFYAVTLLQHLRLPPQAVGRVFLYGEGASLQDFALGEGIFGVRPERLDPIAALDLEREALDPSFDTSPFAPCIGVALG